MAYILIEFILLNLSYWLVLILRLPEAASPALSSTGINPALVLLLVFNICWGFVIMAAGDADYYTNHNFSKRLRHLTKCILLFIGISATIALLFKIDHLNRTVFLMPILFFALLDLLVFNFIKDIINRQVKHNYGANVLVLCGGNEKVFQLSNIFENKFEYATVDYLINDKIENKVTTKSNASIIGKINELPEILDKQNFDEIFITGSSLEKTQIEDVLKIADYRGIRVSLIPESPDNFTHFNSFELEGIPIYQYRKSPLDAFNNYLVKKVFDIVFSLTVITLLLPIYILIALLIMLDGQGSFLYTPLRKGERGRSFKCYKFRTMSVNDNPVNGTKSTVKNDPRITKIGRYLRKYDLDELPQFFNVLKGDMSVVGPRPHRVNLQSDFRKIVNDYMVRHYVKPGITGWAQVNGWRGPTVTDEQKKKRIECDLSYIENWSFGFDLKIIFLTVFSKKTRKNAF